MIVRGSDDQFVCTRYYAESDPPRFLRLPQGLNLGERTQLLKHSNTLIDLKLYTVECKACEISQPESAPPSIFDNLLRSALIPSGAACHCQPIDRKC